MVTQMVMLHCNLYTELFPAFHPVYEPPDWLPMELLKRGKSGVAACNIEVATWDEVPPFSPPEEDLVVASCHTGVCRACHLDIKAQRANLGEDASDAAIVPKMSFLNHMDPVFRFPHEELQDLFDQASVIEVMLLALDHMQVSFVTVGRTGLHKFRRNVISFPQDLPTFAMRAGLLQRYQKDDRVNSVRGPGDQRDRPVRYAYAHPADRERFATDESGCLVYPATIREVLPDGLLVLDYTDASGRVWLGEGVEEAQHVWPRVRMPHQPKFLKGQLAIMLRRNLGHGRVLEGLEVRWSLVSNILDALKISNRKFSKSINWFYKVKHLNLCSP